MSTSSNVSSAPVKGEARSVVSASDRRRLRRRQMPELSLADALKSGQEEEAQGHFIEARAIYHAALANNHASSSEAILRAQVGRRIALSSIHMSDYESAREALATASDVSREAGDDEGVAYAHNSFGIIAQREGDLEEAMRQYGLARENSLKVNAPTLMGMIEQNAGTLATVQGDWMQARACLEASLAAFRQAGKPLEEARVLNNLGMLATDQGDYALAERSYAEAQQRLAGGTDHLLASGIKVGRIELALESGNLPLAAERVEHLMANESAMQGTWRGEILKLAGTVALRQGERLRADAYLRQAITYATQSSDKLLLAEVMRECAELAWIDGRYADTLKSLNESQRGFSSLKARPDIVRVERQVGRLQDKFITVARDWGESIESKDRYTQGHCERVADVACKLAIRAGTPASSMVWFRIGGLLHDVGKIVVPDAVLNKPGKLDPAEWALMASHPEAGIQLLQDVEFPWDIKPMVLSHHEKWDGSGYPHKLPGELIPFEARVLAMADVYDALTTDRPYRTGWTHEKAIHVMMNESPGHFDPELAGIFHDWAAARAAGEE